MCAAKIVNRKPRKSIGVVGVLALGVFLATTATSWSQSTVSPRVPFSTSMSGPRFGLTMLSNGNVLALKEHDINVRPVISQFGWQFEKQFYNNGDGLTVLNEWIPLVSALDQGYALPSLNWLVGVRTSQGTEFGIGPNITPVGIGLVIAGGVTVRSGAVNIPLNFAFASSKSGARVSIMTGFNLRK